MPRSVLSRILLGCLLVLTVGLSTAWAQGDCPPGYHVEGPRGCMPNGPGPGPYYPPPPPPGYYPAPCPPGMVWSYGACRPEPRRGLNIYIGPPGY
ncbi:MAG: hypothetical protein AB7U59_12700 [Desulfovibrionaceae bacterium]